MKTISTNQVAAFGKLVGICNDLGARYNPSEASIKPIALNALLEQAQQSSQAMKVAYAAYTTAVSIRKEAFDALPTLTSRIVSAVTASKSSPELVNDVKMVKRRMFPRRKPAVTAPTAQEGAVNVKEVRTISLLDFESKIDTFGSLIEVVRKLPKYQPNEADLTLAALDAALADLRKKSTEVIAAANAFANARIWRNHILYMEGGILETVKLAKEYIRSLEGRRSDVARGLGKIQLATKRS